MFEFVGICVVVSFIAAIMGKPLVDISFHGDGMIFVSSILSGMLGGVLGVCAYKFTEMLTN